MKNLWDSMVSLIRKKRRDLDISQKELAEKAGVGQSFIAQLEAGKVPSIEVAAKIAKTLNLDFKSMKNAIIVKRYDNIYAPSDPNEIRVIQKIIDLDQLKSAEAPKRQTKIKERKHKKVKS